MQKQEADRKEKQLYLREQIKDKDYNIEDFLNFLSNAKFQGDNIENWTISELKMIVIEFQQKESQRNKLESVDILMDNIHR